MWITNKRAAKKKAAKSSCDAGIIYEMMMTMVMIRDSGKVEKMNGSMTTLLCSNNLFDVLIFAAAVIAERE